MKMIIEAKISQILCIFAFFLLGLPPPTHTVQFANKMDVVQFSNGLETFGVRLFSELAKTNPKTNIVFSPFSIQTCIAMARMGAEGKTALEMDQGLALSAQNTDDLASSYHDILAVYENSSILKVANKIYVMEGCEIQEKFNELLTKQFFSSIDAINFAHSKAAADTINTWVENKTNNLIKDLISPALLDSTTRLVLVNAIYFKGEWIHDFPLHGTREMDFYMDDTNTVKVQMMHTKANFNYGEFPELDATALEMFYKNSDLSMLIILPNTRTGLVALEEKLRNASLSDLTDRMYNTKVIVDMPKFKTEFKSELSMPLQEMGMSRMFTSDAEFGKMLKSKDHIQVSKIIHKAFIEVNEKGTEAAAATAIIAPGSMPMFAQPKEPKRFNANKPFYYTLLNRNGLVIFKGVLQNI